MRYESVSRDGGVREGTLFSGLLQQDGVLRRGGGETGTGDIRTKVAGAGVICVKV